MRATVCCSSSRFCCRIGFWREETKEVRKWTSMLRAEMPLGFIFVTVGERGRAWGG
jgi:hypothetical protein